jgi:hypothetical protein
MRHLHGIRPSLGLLLVVLWGATARPGTGTLQPAAELNPTTFTATGTNVSLLSISEAGRYSIRAKSPQGTRIQLVDRMMGPVASSGSSGVEDGRIDTFLDAGTYRILATSPEKGKGELQLVVHSFEEQNRPLAPVLLENTRIESTLADDQRISYWLEVTTRKTLYLEGQGRDLADMRLWLEGNWLVAAEPIVTEVVPTAGRPETNHLLVANLNPGWYLLTAYGGRTKAWTRETGGHPFHLRYGLRKLATASLIQDKVSPFGVDRYLVPKAANEFSVQLQEKKDFRLDVKEFSTGDNFQSPNETATIQPKSQDPECRVHYESDKDSTLVSLSGSPGESYRLQIFKQLESGTIEDRPGSYWVSTLHGGFPDDNIDATGILVARRQGTNHSEIVAADVLQIGSGSGWSRRFNLLARENVYFHVADAGDYEVRATGVPVNFRFEPFQVTVPEGYKTPGFRISGESWSLDKGYWVLTLKPEAKGIVTVELVKKGDSIHEKNLTKGSCLFPDFTIERDTAYTLYMNDQAGVEKGLVMRRRPLTLLQPLPVTLQPGQETSIGFSCAEDGRLDVAALPDAPFSCWVDGTVAPGAVSKGEHVVKILNSSSKTNIFSPNFTPASLLPESPRTYLSHRILDSFARFPELGENSPLFFDLDRGEKKTALLQVKTPALYRVETTGLLKTSCTIRTRTRVKLFSDDAGGPGENALVQQYLKPGEYQVTIKPLGKCKGHAGLALTRTALVDGGPLAPGRQARERVKVGSAVQYALPVTQAGTYHVWTLGNDKTFRCRLEDRDGWPLVATNAEADVTCPLGAGEFRYMTLPLNVETLRISQIEPVRPERTVEGHGPHVLPLDGTLENVWREPAQGAERQKDVYLVNIPAPVDATIRLGQRHMQARIYLTNGKNPELVGTAPPGKGWSGKLQAGDHRIEVDCSRLNDHLTYTVGLSVEQLVAGGSREVEVPASLTVSVAKAGVVQLVSKGTLDVRGILMKAGNNEVVETSDDAPSDWNFRIDRPLDPGLYTLQVLPVGTQQGGTTIAMTVPAEEVRPPAVLPVDTTADLGGKIAVFPFSVGAGDGFVRLEATGESLLGCALERDSGIYPRVLAHRTGKACRIDLPVDRADQYRFRVWSTDQQVATARVRIIRLAPLSLSLSDLQAPGVNMTGAEGAYSLLARVKVDRPGTFRVTPPGFSFARWAGEHLSAPDTACISLPAGTPVVYWNSPNPDRARIERVVLATGSQNAGSYDVAAGNPMWLDLPQVPGDIAILVTEADSGSPGCALSADGNPVLTGCYTRSKNACVAVGPVGTSRAMIWNTSPAFLTQRQTVRLEVLRQRQETALSVRTPGQIPPGGQTRFALPPGPKHMVVNLERGLIAFPWNGKTAGAIVSALAEPVSQELDTTAEHLIVADLSGKGGYFDASLLKIESVPPEPELGLGGLYERVFPGPCSVRIKINPSVARASGVVLAAGDGVKCQYMADSGIVSSGSHIAIVEGTGYITLTSPGGLVKAWVEKHQGDLASRWGKLDPRPATEISGMAVVPLSGRNCKFSFRVESPQVIHFRTDHPAAAFLADEKGSFLHIAEGSIVCRFDCYLAPGHYTVGARGLEGGSLLGTASFSFTSVVPLVQGVAPECLVAGGEAKTFSFTVVRQGKVGIGIKADREAVRCELLSSEEYTIGTGIQQFVELKPGTYFLRVTTAPHAAPVRIRPAVVGLDPPGLGPTPEAVRNFLQENGFSGGGN